jgi:predicted metal-dependent hydrolase
LFNFAYWWESHEVFEALWHACGRLTPEGRFFQGLVQLAAAHLKRRMGNPAAAFRLFRRACVTLQQAPALCMGIDITTLVQDIERCSTAGDESTVLLRPDFSDEGAARRPGTP